MTTILEGIVMMMYDSVVIRKLSDIQAAMTVL